MKQIWTIFKIEGKLSLRCPDALIFGIAMPVGILCLIGVVGREQMISQESYTFFQSAFPSLLTIGICATAFMGLPLTIADYRDKKILKQFFVTPMNPKSLLLVQGSIAMITALVSAILVSICAVLFFDYHMEGNILLFSLAYGFVLIAMYSIGMIIASVCTSVRKANIICSLVYFPMLFLSGATIPFELFPNFLQNFANMLPLTLGVKLLKNLSLGIVDISTLWIILILALMMTIGLIISVKTFRWE